MNIARVGLWGRTNGAVSIADDSEVAAFQYDPAFARSGIEVAPLMLPLSDRVYQFPELPRATFHGLRSEEHTSELQSLMRISYAVFCLKKKKIITQHTYLSQLRHDSLLQSKNKKR